jgi:hypothetical protein
MTDNGTNKSETGVGPGSALIDGDSSDEEADFAEEPTDLEAPIEVDDDDLAEGGVRGSGAVSGGFGLAGLAGLAAPAGSPVLGKPAGAVSAG